MPKRTINNKTETQQFDIVLGVNVNKQRRLGTCQNVNNNQ